MDTISATTIPRTGNPAIQETRRPRLFWLGTVAGIFLGAVLLVLGRYVPGLRFVINTTMGLSDRRYRDFLTWSALGGVLWSTATL